MSKQPEALRLADELADWSEGPDTVVVLDQAAAELRCLQAENERLHQINQSHEMKLSVRGYEIQIEDLVAHRDQLLEALRKHVYLHDKDCVCEDCAVIKQAEENT